MPTSHRLMDRGTFMNYRQQKHARAFPPQLRAKATQTSVPGGCRSKPSLPQPSALVGNVFELHCAQKAIHHFAVAWFEGNLIPLLGSH